MSGVEIYRQGQRCNLPKDLACVSSSIAGITIEDKIYTTLRWLFLSDDLALEQMLQKATLCALSRDVEINIMELLWLKSIVGIR